MKKVVMVTGGTGGIGKKIIARLEDSYEIIAPSRIELDLSSEESVEKYVLEMSKHQVDILINNAAIQKINSLERISMKEFHELLQVNLVSAFTLSVNFSQGMKKRRFGRIVNMSSIWSFLAKENRTVYAASKSGLNSITRSLAIELGRHNVLVNAIAAGYVGTKMTYMNNTEKDLQEIISRIPLQRLSDPKEIAECVAFLCSENNSYMTGQVLIVDGGYSCY